MKVGIGSIAQAKIQPTFGTSVAPDTKLNLASETLSVSRNHGDEGNLLASKTPGRRDLLSIGVGGGMSFILCPEMADWLSLSRDCRRTPGVDARWVCVFIFRNYSDIQVITIGTWIFTRSTINRAGSRFHV